MTGRFAPSPTGPLHFGSLLAAAASYFDARAAKQSWLLRIDDLDVPRTVTGAADAIKATLDAHGLHWDGPTILQSVHGEVYEQALQALTRLELTYYCRCSRRKLKGHRAYPGTCRAQRAPCADSAIRVLVGDAVVEFDDLIQGPQRDELANTVGDFVVRRRDGLIAYQLATAVDDGADGIDSVVRGNDLLDNSARQIYLMRLLGLTPPSYAHIPMLTHPDGSKLSKQTFATPVDTNTVSANLARVLDWLGQSPPTHADRWSSAELITWGVENWDLDQVPRVATIAVVPD
jgi:glutamyl-Q tRNA(Asp) synthetase